MNVMDMAKAKLLEPTNLDVGALESTLGQLMGSSIDAGDLYFQSLHHESMMLEDGIIKEGGSNISTGVGVRAMSGDKTGFAYSDDLQVKALNVAAKSAKQIAQSGKSQSFQAFSQNTPIPRYDSVNPIEGLSYPEKLSILREVDAYLRAKSPLVKEVIVTLSASFDTMLVVATDGTFCADVRPLVRFNVQVIVERQGQRESGSSGLGGRYGYQDLTVDNRHLETGDQALERALLLLDAEDAPAGLMPVVLGPGWPGVLLHEAVGHGLEGDFNRKKTSAFSDRVGEQVASPLCTVVDDGTIANTRGALSVDDEGVPSNRTVLIENGILKGYLQDKLNARLMGVRPTGNGRRESFAHCPMPRMTNTFMLNGPHHKEEIIQSVDKGLYAEYFGGGSVDITSGKFVFSATCAYLIENGKITKPVKGATLIGNGPAVMNRISMVANDMALDTGIGTCGKDGQSVPVGVGQPTLKIDELTVGGTKQ